MRLIRSPIKTLHPGFNKVKRPLGDTAACSTNRRVKTRIVPASGEQSTASPAGAGRKSAFGAQDPPLRTSPGHHGHMLCPAQPETLQAVVNCLTRL